MAGPTTHRRGRVPALLALLTAAAGLSASPALGADTIYWANYSADTIGTAPLDGSGGADLSTAGASPPSSPSGVAIDAGAGRVYWADGNGPISYANLDGSGSGGELSTTGTATASVRGLAIDSAGRRIYWVNQSAPAAEALAYANLDGPGGGYLSYGLASPPASPAGLAIDPGANRIYWADQTGDKISYANLDGSGGGGDLTTTGATVDTPTGLALDPPSNRLFITNFDGVVSYVNLDESGGADLSVSPLTPGGLYGAAIDHGTGRIYFVDFSGAIDSASLGGGGGETLGTGSATPGNWLYPAILEQPAGTTPPAVNGDPFKVATSALGPLTSPSNRFKLGKATLNEKRGTASLAVTVPGPGLLKSTVGRAGGHRAGASAANFVGAAGTVKVPIAASGKIEKKLERAGGVKVTVRIVFTPNGGTAAVRTRALTLVKRR